jgi:type II secretory pathway component PulF
LSVIKISVPGRDAADAEAVERELDARGLLLLEASTGVAAVESPHRFRLRGRIRRADVVEATRAVASLLRAGLPLARALETASGVASGPAAAALADVRARVERGAGLQEAMESHPEVFSPLYRGLVCSGDRSGELEGVFKRLAEYLARQRLR